MKRDLKRDNKGMTLIELLCAVAIFSMLMATVCGLIVMVAKVYRGGTTETTLQQESQLTANIIGNLIMGATDSVDYYYENGAGGFVYAESESAAIAAGAGTDTDRMLEIVNGTTAHDIYFRAATGQITYIENTGGVAPLVEYTVAENVTRFTADVSDFTDSKNVIVDIKMERDNSEYAMTYNMTSRNEDVTTASGGLTDWALIAVDTEIVMEPCQTLELGVHVTGTQTAYSWGLIGCSSSLTTATSSAGGIMLHLDKDETGNGSGFIVLQIRTNAIGADGNPLAMKNVFIRVRRVKDMNTLTLEKENPLALDFATGTKYIAKTTIIGTNLNKKVNNTYDMVPFAYMNPYYAKWSWEFTVNGVSTNPASYFNFTIQEDVLNPSLEIELIQNMPSNSKLTIKALAKHPEGTIGGVAYNKTGNKYDTIEKVIALECVTGGGVPEVISPFKRGEPYFFSGEVLDTSIRTSYESVDSTVQMNWFWRMREIHDDGSYGAWTSYYKTLEGGNTKKINEAETECFLPDKAYQVEYISVVYSEANKKIYWPHDDNLLVAGTGFAEQHYDKTWVVNDTPEIDYKTLYVIGKVEIDFKANPTFAVGEGDKSFRTLFSPAQLYHTAGIRNLSAQFKARFIRANNGTEGSDFKDSFIPVYEYWNGTSWIPATPIGWQMTQYDDMNFRLEQEEAYATGLYRIGVALRTGLFKAPTGTLMSPAYSNYPVTTYPLYDASTGNGYIYVQFNP